MNIRLVVADLDGTLLDSKKRIPPENKDAIHRLSERNIQFGIVTGRRLSGLVPYVRALELPTDPWLVCNSGALITEGLSGKILNQTLLDRELAMEVMRLGTQSGAAPVVHDGPNGEGRILVPRHSSDKPALQRYLDATAPPPVWVDRIELTRDPVQVMFADTIVNNRDLEERLTSRLAGSIRTLRTEYRESDLSLLDILAPGATKRDGLRFLMKTLSVVPEEVLAVGDNWNDLEMLELSGHAAIMGNADPELKARFPVTGTNDEAGLAQAIAKFI